MIEIETLILLFVSGGMVYFVWGITGAISNFKPLVSGDSRARMPVKSPDKAEKANAVLVLLAPLLLVVLLLCLVLLKPLFDSAIFY